VYRLLRPRNNRWSWRKRLKKPLSSLGNCATWKKIEKRRDVHRHEVHRKNKKVALEEEEERAILFEVVLAKQDAIEAAKQQVNDEAEEKGNLKKRSKRKERR
jgi:hypothetical protein